MKHIILCADDYGQNQAISQAIIKLIEKKRLSATSCMANASAWSECSAWLKPFINQVDIGLHLNLSEGRPLSQAFQKHYGPQLFSLPQLLIRSHLHFLNKKVILAEINAQLDAFVEKMGILPNFIDGHQHVHHLPVVRDALLEVYEQRLQQSSSYLRCVYDGKTWVRWRDSSYIKQLVIQLTGAKRFKELLQERNIPHNTSFAGIYNFAEAMYFPKKIAQFIEQIQNGGLIMCHPGLAADGMLDPIYHSRELEYHYLLSQDFFDLCITKSCQLQKPL